MAKDLSQTASRWGLTSANHWGLDIEDVADWDAVVQKPKDKNVGNAVSCTVTLEKVPGIVNIGEVKNAMEVYNFLIGVERHTDLGLTGQQESNAKVIISDMHLVLQNDKFRNTALEATFKGQNVGKMVLTKHRNIGTTAQETYNITTTNTRITFARQHRDLVFLKVNFDTIAGAYKPVGDDSKQSGNVAWYYNLTTNSPKK